jgi:hypothetical protein
MERGLVCISTADMCREVPVGVQTCCCSAFLPVGKWVASDAFPRAGERGTGGGKVLLVSVVAMMLAISVEAGGGSMQETKCRCDMMLEKTWAKVSWLRLAAP